MFDGRNLKQEGNEEADTARYLLLVTADEWHHDADEWIGIYSDDEELRVAYEQSIAEFNEERKKGYYSDAQHLAIMKFTPREKVEKEDRWCTFTYEQRIREVKPEELHCFKNPKAE